VRENIPLVIFLLETLHVLSNMATVDVLLEDLSVKGFAFRVITGETLVRVGDEDTTIAGTLHSTEETGSGGGALETNIEVALERAGSVLFIKDLSVSKSAVRLSDTLIFIGEAELGESTASDEETSSVCYKHAHISMS
jgi:hypothetical protein